MSRSTSGGPSELAAASPDNVRLLPAAHAIRLSAIPYGSENGFLRVAFVNPSNLAAIDEVVDTPGVQRMSTAIALSTPVPPRTRPLLERLLRVAGR